MNKKYDHEFKNLFDIYTFLKSYGTDNSNFGS